jgi:hypothetical protein
MRRDAFAFLLTVAVVMATRDVRAYCRTTTCGLPPDYSPSVEGACTPPDFAALCESETPPVNPVPPWWRNACISYDVQQDASVQIPYATAAQLAAEAFAKWTGVMCPNGQSSSRVSIDVRDLGPVSCDEVQYSSDQGNQHVIVFRDNGSPDFDTNNTLGLTTVTFDPASGEIYDADMEINSSVTLAVGDPVPADGYDFQSIITHEAGHFLGLAHSVDLDATMYAQYLPGTTTKRILTADDMDGICSIYLPDGYRSVDPSVDPSGQVLADACDPTPRHGFQSECAQPVSASCRVATAEPPAPMMPAILGAVGMLGAAGAFRRATARGRALRM